MDVCLLDWPIWSDYGNIADVIKKIAVDVSGANTKNLVNKDDFSEAIADLMKDIADFKFDLSTKITNALRWSFVFCVGSTAITIGVMWLILKK